MSKHYFADKDYSYSKAEINKAKLDSLCNITSIGDGLKLESDGTLKMDVPNTWEDIQEVTRRGVAPSVLTIGQTYKFQRDGADINAKVMGFITENGRAGSIKIKDNNLQYGVIFQTEDCLYSLQFDEREAFYYTPTGLSAGDYCFVLGQHSWYSADVGKTFYFTLANSVPAGGQLVFTQAYNATLENATINVFNSSTTYSANQTAVMSSTEISGATNLGTLNNAFNGNFNSCQRALFGNNRWKESALRQHLNSNAVAGSVWTPQNNWDRCPSWRTSTKGFINGLSSSFLPYVAECSIDTYKNTVCDGGGLDTTDDKFFLPGRMEAFMPSEATADNGAYWAYYKNGSTSQTPHTGADAVRIKYLNDSATYWWLRSPSVGDAYIVRFLSPTGAYSYSYAYISYGVAPAFVIA